MRCKIYFFLFFLGFLSCLNAQIILANETAVAGDDWSAGDGFNTWSLTYGDNTGKYVGNPGDVGISTTNIGTVSFALYATGTQWVDAFLQLDQPMQVGEKLTFYWAINWDANGGSKGFEFQHSSTSSATSFYNLLNTNSSTITAAGVDADTGYGTTPMFVTLDRISSTQYEFTMTSRSGGSDYTHTINESNALDQIKFFCGNQNDGSGQRNMFFNKFKIQSNSSSVTISSDRTLDNLEVLSSTTLTIDPAGSLDVSGTLTNNGTIVMQSSSSTSAALMAANISGLGTYTYQKYVASTSTNDLISAPFTGETFSNLVGNNSGVLVQNTSPTTEYLFGPFDNDTGAYLTYDSTTNPSPTLSAGQGYRAGTASGATLEFTGAFETSNQSIAINVGSDATYGKWNLVGNPFPSYLDLAGFISDNSAILEDVNTAVYAYDGDDSDGSNFTIYHASNSSGVSIAPGQAFFVASSSGGGNLVFNTSRQTVTGGDDFLQRQAQTLDSFFKLNLESSNSLTYTDFYFNSNAGEGLDIGYDVGTYANLTSSFSLYSKLASGEYFETNFAIQTISNDLSETVVIPLGVHISSGENHSISIDDVSLLESINVYLKDYETGTLTLLNNSAYSFSTNSALEGTSRFELRLTNTTLGLESDELMTNFKAVYQNDAVILVGDFMIEDKVEIYDIMGRLTQSHTISGNHSLEITKNKLATGLYLAKINRNGSSKNIKFIIN